MNTSGTGIVNWLTRNDECEVCFRLVIELIARNVITPILWYAAPYIIEIQKMLGTLFDN